MAEAKAGITDLIRKVAADERMDPETLRRAVAAGRVVIPLNPIHNPVPKGIGEGCSIKVNVNLGTSEDCMDVEEELEKAKVAMKFGADAIMDLSTGGDIDAIRARIIKEVNIPIGTVPIYQAGLEMARKCSVIDMTEDMMFNGIEKHAKDGVDFMTVHTGITKESIGRLKKCGRLT
ncbi:MAG: phosphomethylpyrimidine synthase ThiC, partial [Thermoplasmata archaeon]|nr:phosphomethylpyrimidine synthase ThiC [Thermoplasmata archaeon]